MINYKIGKILNSAHLISHRKYEKLRRDHLNSKNSSYRIVAESALFNRKWYLENYPDVAEADMDPAEHYLRHGWKESRNPSAEFDNDAYLKAHPECKICPLVFEYNLHNKPLQTQVRKKRITKTVKTELKLVKRKVVRRYKKKKTAENDVSDYDLLAQSEYFDKKWYLEQYPKVAEAKFDPIVHYLKYGWKEGRNPSEKFDTKFYMEKYKDVAESKINPLVHYITKGKAESRRAKSSNLCNLFKFLQKKEIPLQKHSPNYDLLVQSKYFDRKWYLNQYPEVKDAGLDPIDHYLKYGWKEGRNPSKKFDGNNYLDLYEDVQKSGLCPLVHYLKFGQKEHRNFKRKKNPKDIFVLQLLNYGIFKKRKKEILSDSTKKFKICFISYSNRFRDLFVDPSVRYRCYNLAEALEERAAVASVNTLTNFCKYPSYNYDIYVFHRPTVKTEKFKQIFNNLKRLHKIVIADYDDLIFGDEKNIELSTIKLCQGRNDEETKYNFECFTEALKLFDNISVSTPALKEAVLKIKPQANVQVIHNFVPSRLLALAEDAGWRETDKNQNLVMYCSGGKSHNADFELIKPALLNCLAKDQNLQLRILGNLDLPVEFKNNPRCEVVSRVDYLDMFNLMSDAAITIAPLVDTFNNLCKSNIKFLESSLVGNLLLTSSCSLTAADSSPKTFMGLAKEVADWENLILKRKELLAKKYKNKNVAYIEKKYSERNFLNEWSELLDNYKGE